MKQKTNKQTKIPRKIEDIFIKIEDIFILIPLSKHTHTMNQ